MDDEVAALYRVPLGEFTAARNALAKQRGSAGAGVRALEKPQAAAWAVNQLFWERRAAYDAVIDAARMMRAAHARMLSGRKADVAQADTAHRDAMRAATRVIRELAKAAGESLSPATLDAVSETLRALPSDDPPGRLTRPLKPLGFEALLTVNVQGPESRVQGPGSRVRGPGSVKKEAAARAAKQKLLRKALRAAEAAERDADSALADARKAVAKVERDYAAVRDRLQFLEKQRADVEQEAQRRARALQDAANARTQAEQDLGRETSGVPSGAPINWRG
jgi:DNA repair exonuclease SbcCD ATPase subunit